MREMAEELAGAPEEVHAKIAGRCSDTFVLLLHPLLCFYCSSVMREMAEELAGAPEEVLAEIAVCCSDTSALLLHLLLCLLLQLCHAQDGGGSCRRS
jgi:uncharacterized protein YjeT (DUF2065 family)